MKKRIQLTIEDDLLNKIKIYAQKRQISVSKLVEDYFEKLAIPTTSFNFIEAIDQLVKPDIDDKLDLKESYYQNQATKHGF